MTQNVRHRSALSCHLTAVDGPDHPFDKWKNEDRDAARYGAAWSQGPGGWGASAWWLEQQIKM